MSRIERKAVIVSEEIENDGKDGVRDLRKNVNVDGSTAPNETTGVVSDVEPAAVMILIIDVNEMRGAIVEIETDLGMMKEDVDDTKLRRSRTFSCLLMLIGCVCAPVETDFVSI